MKRLVGLAIAVAVAVSVTAAAQARPVGGSPHKQRVAVTFTKWLTSFPNDPSAAGASMTGVVGGDVGPGTFTGLIIRDDTTSRPGHWLGQALYGFTGSTHSFVAYNFINENDTTSPATATIRGVVVQGWMVGARVTGEYTQWDPCPIPTPGNVFGSMCFQGTLHLQLGDDEEALTH